MSQIDVFLCSIESDIEALEATNELRNLFRPSIGAHSPAVLLHIAAGSGILLAPVLDIFRSPPVNRLHVYDREL